jgi:hypothetical protein
MLLMTVLGDGSRYPPWVRDRLGESNTRDGDPKINQNLSDDGYAETDPVKCRQSVFNHGVQRRFE